MGMAENYDEVLKGKYPAKAHAKRVAEWIVEKGGDKKGTIYLEAQKQRLLEVCGHAMAGVEMRCEEDADRE
jgi:Xaa-Pro dipeptidase